MSQKPRISITTGQRSTSCVNPTKSPSEPHGSPISAINPLADQSLSPSGSKFYYQYFNDQNHIECF
ncbi:hypothetical protein [Candidatus Lokiarchaeum ossiferum]